MAKRLKIYISLPITDKDKERQMARAEELAHRLRCKGYEPVNPFALAEALDGKWDGDGKPDWYDYMAEDVFNLLQCDGMLVDIDAKHSYGCSIELGIAQAMAASPRKKFIILHTKEQWKEVNARYTI